MNRFDTTMGIFRQAVPLSSKACIVVNKDMSMHMSFIDRLHNLKVPFNTRESFGANIKVLFDAISTDLAYDAWTSTLADAEDDSIFNSNRHDKYSQLRYQEQWGARHLDIDLNYTFAPLWAYDTIPEFFYTKTVANNDTSLTSMSDLIANGGAITYSLETLGIKSMLEAHVKELRKLELHNPLQFNEFNMSVRGIDVSKGTIEESSYAYSRTDSSATDQRHDIIQNFKKFNYVCANTVNILFENDFDTTSSYDTYSAYCDTTDTETEDADSVRVVEKALYFANEYSTTAATELVSCMPYYDVKQTFEDFESTAFISFTRRPIQGEFLRITIDGVLLDIYFAADKVISQTSTTAIFGIGDTVQDTLQQTVDSINELGFKYELHATLDNDIIVINGLRNTLSLSLDAFAYTRKITQPLDYIPSALAYYVTMSISEEDTQNLSHVIAGDEQITILQAAKLTDTDLVLHLEKEPTNKFASICLHTNNVVQLVELTDYPIADMQNKNEQDDFEHFRSLRFAMYAEINTADSNELAEVNAIVAAVEEVVVMRTSEDSYATIESRLQEDSVDTYTYLGKLSKSFVNFGHAHGNGSNNLPYYLNWNLSYGLTNNSVGFDTTEDTYDAHSKDWFIVGYSTYATAPPRHLPTFATSEITIADVVSTTIDLYATKLTHVINTPEGNYDLPIYAKTYLKHSTDFCYAFFKGVEYRLPIAYYSYKFSIIALHADVDSPVVKNIINDKFDTFTVVVYSDVYRFRDNVAAYEFLRLSGGAQTEGADNVYMSFKWVNPSGLQYEGLTVSTPIVVDGLSNTLVGITYNVDNDGIDANIVESLPINTLLNFTIFYKNGGSDGVVLKVKSIDTATKTIWMSEFIMTISDTATAVDFANDTEIDILTTLSYLDDAEIFTLSDSTVTSTRWRNEYAYNNLRFNTTKNIVTSSIVDIVDPFSLDIANNLVFDTGRLVDNDEPGTYTMHRYLGDYVPAANIVLYPTDNVNHVFDVDIYRSLLIGTKFTSDTIVSETIDPSNYTVHTNLRIADGLQPITLSDSYMSEYSAIVSKTVFALADEFVHVFAEGDTIEHILELYLLSKVPDTIAHTIRDYVISESLLTVEIYIQHESFNDLVLVDGTASDEIPNDVLVNDKLLVKFVFDSI